MLWSVLSTRILFVQLRSFLRQFAEVRGHLATALKVMMDEVSDKVPSKDSYLKITQVSTRKNVHFSMHDIPPGLCCELDVAIMSCMSSCYL